MKKADLKEKHVGMKMNSDELITMLDIIHQANTINYEMGEDRKTMVIWGKHGISKTAIIKDYVVSNNMEYIRITPSQFEESGDLLGINTIKKDEKGNEYTKFSTPSFIPTHEAKNGGILLIDDINRGNDRIIQSLMELVQFYTLVSIPEGLPKGWTIVATANYDTIDYNVSNIDFAVLTRMINFSMVFNLQSFKKYATTPNSMRMKSYKRQFFLENIKDKWDDMTPIDSKLFGFFDEFPEDVIYDSVNTVPRTWGNFNSIVRFIPNWIENKNIIYSFARATLGDNTAIRLLEYIENTLGSIVSYTELLAAKDDEELERIFIKLENSLNKNRTQKVAMMDTLFETMKNYIVQNIKNFKFDDDKTHRPIINLIKFLIDDRGVNNENRFLNGEQIRKFLMVFNDEKEEIYASEVYRILFEGKYNKDLIRSANFRK